MRILGIETSCDETSAAIIETKPKSQNVKLLSNVVSSSLKLHAKTGGIIPEVASRQQLKYIIPVIKKALSDSNLYPLSSKFHSRSSTIYRPAIDAIAVTIGPGLIGSLLVGIETAKTLAYAWNKPIIPVNHLIGHIYANWIKCHPGNDSGSNSGRKEIADQVRNDKKIEFPTLSLIVSGGHTDLVLIKTHGKIQWLGGTRDDAAGEALDKIGRLLNLPYPAGPTIEQLAQKGNPRTFQFPRPMIKSNDFDFSFSGLKTAVFREIKTMKQPFDSAQGGLNNQAIRDLSASVQQAIIDVLIAKALKAAQKYKARSILLGGGVAANQKLRDDLKLKIARFAPLRRIEASARRENFKLKIPFFAPEKWLCTDNAAMIASAAFFNYKQIPWQKVTANPELYFD